jgi:hypothetical protein
MCTCQLIQSAKIAFIDHNIRRCAYPEMTLDKVWTKQNENLLITPSQKSAKLLKTWYRGAELNRRHTDFQSESQKRVSVVNAIVIN